MERLHKEEAIKAAWIIKNYCAYLHGVPCPSDCCFRFIDADGYDDCSLDVCAPSEWSLPKE